MEVGVYTMQGFFRSTEERTRTRAALRNMNSGRKGLGGANSPKTHISSKTQSISVQFSIFFHGRLRHTGHKREERSEWTVCVVTEALSVPGFRGPSKEGAADGRRNSCTFTQDASRGGQRSPPAVCGADPAADPGGRLRKARARLSPGPGATCHVPRSSLSTSTGILGPVYLLKSTPLCLAGLCRLRSIGSLTFHLLTQVGRSGPRVPLSGQKKKKKEEKKKERKGGGKQRHNSFI